MAQQIILKGSVANDGQGDSLRITAEKINENFTEVYNTLGSVYDVPVGTTLVVNNTTDALEGANGGLYVVGGIKVLKNIYAANTVRAGEGSDDPTFVNPVFVGKKSGSQYVQMAVVNSDGHGSADITCYSDVGNETQGWCDMGFTGSSFNDSNYSITKQGDGYVFVLGDNDGFGHGNLVLATGDLGLEKDIIFATGGFGENNEVMRFVHATKTFSIANNLTVGESITANVAYIPADITDWTAPEPTTLAEAIDRLAAVVKVLNSGTGS